MSERKYGIPFSFLLMLFGYFLAGIGSLVTMMFLLPALDSIISIPSGTLMSLVYFSLSGILVDVLFSLWVTRRKKFNPVFYKIKTGYVFFLFFIFTLLFFLGKASLLNQALIVPILLAFPLFPLILILSLFGGYNTIIVIGILLFGSLVLLLLIKKQWKFQFISVFCLLCAALCLLTYVQSPHYKYRNQSHHFQYMGGFSSTDLSDYTVYSESGKLVTLDHEPEFIIENPSDMPVMDGAEACYPVYAAVAKALYHNIAEIELQRKEAYDQDESGEIVTFYNTAVGFERLIHGDVDLFFGARPSKSQLELAEEAGVELVYTPIGKEAFVFFVEENNPVDSLTSDQIRSIYHGEITNWKEVGGHHEKIVAFQRPERSGSQSMMVAFMNDVPLKEPMTYEMESGMMGIIEKVAEYENEAGAIGYSFRYFLEGLNEVENVKILKVDDVYPTNESIQNDTYPITTSLYCISVKDNENEYVQKVIDFLLSEDGQYLIEQTGYIPLN